MVTDTEIGELLCGNCGFVFHERMEESNPEWRSSSKDDVGDRSRTGTPISLAMHDMGLATIIGREDNDASGRPLTASMKNMIERLRTWDSRSQIHQSSDRNFRHAFSILDNLKNKLVLSDAVIEKTAYIYRKALERGLVRGRSISGMVAASLYAACRDTETPRTLADIASGINIKRTDVARCYRILLVELDLKMPIIDPIKCISKIASNAGLDEKIKRMAINILNNVIEIEHSVGKAPMGLAAAALYLSCVLNGTNKTQKDIAMASGVTEVTIRNRSKGFKESLKLKDEPEFFSLNNQKYVMMK